MGRRQSQESYLPTYLPDCRPPPWMAGSRGKSYFPIYLPDCRPPLWMAGSHGKSYLPTVLTAGHPYWGWQSEKLLTYLPS